ncbi:uncharacterized protein MELLADRAFT_93455 [Melampsora larici-populina 98AG31]|uniref:Uncharacterized protein n=1 Tax=Melampsora larici-populina (strain 98AG31 / pathotype 3-4-7) TaxID=747676 RepID=F4RAF9_MELLP|nr:uncharacterized protein MELLADRAFT_93455 [Melampsora larici-populina 98AG31]EGG10473.1 hypothetical protein MELLADRAFT_93455 [Melampsora larici-populina 98AG31]
MDDDDDIDSHEAVTHWLHHQLTRATYNTNSRDEQTTLIMNPKKQPTQTRRSTYPNGWPIELDFVTSRTNLFQSVSPSARLNRVNMCPGSGYETDESHSQCHSQPRRSSRITTPVRLEPGMIQPCQDSRRGLFNPSSQPPPSSIGTKRARSTSRSNCKMVGGHIVPNQGQKSKEKTVSSQNRTVKKPQPKRSNNRVPASTASSVTNASGKTQKTQAAQALPLISVKTLTTTMLRSVNDAKKLKTTMTQMRKGSMTSLCTMKNPRLVMVM